ncbi:MAG: trimethylamine methyltransferase family protein [Eubacteriales bacterium]
MDFLDKNHTEYLHDKALDLLETAGVAAESFITDKVKNFEGICFRNGRLYFKRSLVQKVLDDNFALISKNMPKAEPGNSGKIIRIGVCDLPQYYHHPESGKTELMTVRSLVDSVKFLESIKQNKTGVWSMVPGVPRDVPYRLQAITEYYIGCEYCSSGGNVDTIYPDEAIDFIFQMAEAMEAPFKSAGMFTLSPLKLGGFEMAVAFKRMDYFDSFSISSLPMPGSTGPIFLTPSWIVSIAEAAAGAVTLYLASGGKPVYISTGMFPFEPRKAWVAGGMPEHSMMEYQRGIIGPRYNPTLTYSHSMTTSAKEPGFQAAAEKSAGAMFAAAKGCIEFNTAGLLSFDDIFSPVQFVLDVEIRDLVQAYTNGPAEEYTDWNKVISEGIKDGYFAADTTLDNYEKAYYFPNLFDRNPLDKKSGRAAGYDSVHAAKLKALEYIRQYNYNPDGAKLTEVRKIFNSAWEKLAPGCENPLKHLQNKQ